VLDRPIRQVEHPIRANARGAAALAALGLRRASLTDVARSVRVVETFDPDPANRAVYDELYREFRAIHKQTKGIYARLHAHG
jgi:xylulokinase